MADKTFLLSFHSSPIIHREQFTGKSRLHTCCSCFSRRDQVKHSDLIRNNSVICVQSLDYRRPRVPVGVARTGKTANCSRCTANTHVFVQIWSHPDCVCLKQIFNSVEWKQLFPFLDATARQQSDLRVSCGEKLKIEAFFFFFKRKNILTNPTGIIAEVTDVLFYLLWPRIKKPDKTRQRQISCKQTHTQTTPVNVLKEASVLSFKISQDKINLSLYLLDSNMRPNTQVIQISHEAEPPFSLCCTGLCNTFCVALDYFVWLNASQNTCMSPIYNKVIVNLKYRHTHTRPCVYHSAV